MIHITDKEKISLTMHPKRYVPYKQCFCHDLNYILRQKWYKQSNNYIKDFKKKTTYFKWGGYFEMQDNPGSVSVSTKIEQYNKWYRY